MEQQAVKEPAPSPMGQDATFVRRAFAAIAGRYVLTNHVLSMGIDVLWRRKTARAVAALQPSVVLDVATGSGDLAAAIQKACPDATVVGLDFSAPMLQEARKRGLRHLLVADAMNLPVADGVADVLTVAFGLRNMASWPAALQEMSRVLRPGGSLFVLDFSLPTQPLMRRLHLFYLRKIMPRIAGVLTGERGAFEYLCNTIEQFPSGQNMCRMIQENGFHEAEAMPLSAGIASLYRAVK
ncbi:MAG TPA: ubiquinone/menaquinone biosynthesis methyltransferase [Candidatus Saccharimonadia bacterium]|nr:ubiquinone/menaquinone biosynthesis methyltransferase [Candidatus Saccharimonadia bacterium]